MKRDLQAQWVRFFRKEAENILDQVAESLKTWSPANWRRHSLVLAKYTGAPLSWRGLLFPGGSSTLPLTDKKRATEFGWHWKGRETGKPSWDTPGFLSRLSTVQPQSSAELWRGCPRTSGRSNMWGLLLCINQCPALELGAIINFLPSATTIYKLSLGIYWSSVGY